MPLPDAAGISPHEPAAGEPAFGETVEPRNFEATIVLDRVPPDELEAEATGYAVRERRHVPPTIDYVGSVVVMLEAAP